MRTYQKGYGLHTFAVDVLWVAVAVAAGEDGGPGIASLGYLFAGSIVHGLHGNGRSALYSVGLRVSLPLLGALAGGASQGDCDEIDCAASIALGAGIGALSALIIDWSALSKKAVPFDPGSDVAGRSRTYSIVPQLAPARGGAQLGVAGTF